MALTYTPDAELGAACPNFTARSVDGQNYSLADFSSAQVLVVMFICNHCPYVKAVEDRIITTSKRLSPLGAQFVAVCSNDPTDYPEDRPEALHQRWREKSYGFPYLVDDSQEIAKQFGAVCTPDFFVYDSSRKLAYRGRLDDSWKDAEKVTQTELENAIHSLLKGDRPPSKQKPSMGCSIKWRN